MAIGAINLRLQRHKLDGKTRPIIQRSVWSLFTSRYYYYYRFYYYFVAVFYNARYAYSDIVNWIIHVIISWTRSQLHSTLLKTIHNSYYLSYAISTQSPLGLPPLLYYLDSSATNAALKS